MPPATPIRNGFFLSPPRAAADPLGDALSGDDPACDGRRTSPPPQLPLPLPLPLPSIFMRRIFAAAAEADCCEEDPIQRRTRDATGVDDCHEAAEADLLQLQMRCTPATRTEARMYVGKSREGNPVAYGLYPPALRPRA